MSSGETGASAHNNVGNALFDQGRVAEAIHSYRQALQIDPNDADVHNNLGIALNAQGQIAEAINSFRQALRIHPEYANALNNLGNALRHQGQPAEAALCYRQALRGSPNHAPAHNNLGIALLDQGDVAQAIDCFRQALGINPNYANALNNLGVALKSRGELAEPAAPLRRLTESFDLAVQYHQNGDSRQAEALCRQVLEADPAHAAAHHLLGILALQAGRHDEAERLIRRAIALNPANDECHVNLGIVLMNQARPAEAIECYREALRLNPHHALAHNNLGNILRDQGELAEAIACYREALRINPDLAIVNSNLIYTLHFCPGYDARTIHDENRRWNRRFAEPLAKLILPHDNDRSPDRRLRIGYVSPDFSSHPVGRFLLPLLEAHDHRRMEIYCYASVRVPDAVTDRCRAHADVWRHVLGLSDERVAQVIREDRIDVLVDLTMHTDSNRLLVFARKPAPVQATYLAYCGTTGLSALDYRLTDPYLDPPGQNDGFYAEESIWLPQTYWCYQPPTATPSVNRLPAMEKGHVTFGCLNNFSKVTEPTLGAWRRLLKALPEARLFLHANAGSHRGRVRDFMAQEDISPKRILFVDRVAAKDYFRAYDYIDIALDPFPYGGGTTTCDALWMGVPVVSLAGQTAVGRGGLSILSNIGMAELVAPTAEEYVDIAVRLAGDIPRLSNLRATLRARLQSSPLMDAPRFARSIEAAYRQMWHRYCKICTFRENHSSCRQGDHLIP